MAYRFESGHRHHKEGHPFGCLSLWYQESDLNPFKWDSPVDCPSASAGRRRHHNVIESGHRHHKKYPLTAIFGCFGYFFFAFHFPIFLKKVQKSGGQSEGTSFLKPGRFPGSHWQKQPWNRNSDGYRYWMWWKYRCAPATPESPSGSHHWHTKDSRSYALTV